MKTKSLFVVIALLMLPIALRATTETKTDVYNFESGLFGVSYLEVDGLTWTGASSGAKYNATLTYFPDDVEYGTTVPTGFMDESSKLVTMVSPGIAKSVSIKWDAVNDEYNGVGESELKIYGKNTAFTGEEDPSMLAAAYGATLLETLVYDGTVSASVDVSSYGDYEYIAITTSTYASLATLSISWTVTVSAEYTISKSVTGYGSVTWTPSSGLYEDTKVTVNFAATKTPPAKKSELHSYQIKKGATILKSETFDEDSYPASYSTTFDMPDGNVTIYATYDLMPSRAANYIYINESLKDYAATIESGLETQLTIRLTAYSGSVPAYTRGLKPIVSSTGRTEIVSLEADPGHADQYILTLRGKETGTDELSIKTYQTDIYKAYEGTISIEVVPRDVALITEFDGKYYALTQESDGEGHLRAQEVIYDGGVIYYNPTGISASDMQWKMETLQGALSPYYYIQDASGDYLYNEGSEDIGIVSSSCKWFKSGEYLYTTGSIGVVLYGEIFLGTTYTKYLTEPTYSQSVIEVPLTGANFVAAKHFSTSDGGADAKDIRTLTAGKYGTICVPFNAPLSFAEGAEFYTIAGKTISGDNLNELIIEQVTTNLEAGHSYMYYTTGTSIDIYGGAIVSNAVVDGSDGFVGCLPGDGEVSGTGGVTPRYDGFYGLKDNLLHYVASGTPKAKTYRALINAAEISESGGGSSAPGRKVIMSYEAENTATGVDELVDGKFINWDEPVYNVMGIRVAKGSTGVLIQNGKKFLAQ